MKWYAYGLCMYELNIQLHTVCMPQCHSLRFKKKLNQMLFTLSFKPSYTIVRLHSLDFMEVC